MLLIITLLLFLLWLNLMPPLAALIFGHWGRLPLDLGHKWIDGRPLFGPHKTLRGIVASLLGGALAAPLLFGLPWWDGLLGGALAMGGDLISSFAKRRFRQSSGTDIVVLDQLFEGLLPLLFLRSRLEMTWTQLLDVLLLFVLLAYLSSRFWHYMLFEPERRQHPSVVRSTVRLREWRSCHVPLARWKTLLNLTSLLSNRYLFTWIFTITGLYDRGVANTLDMAVSRHTLKFDHLPPAFDGFRILLLTDLHLDCLDELTDRIIAKIDPLDYDLCLIGGDIRMEIYGPTAPCLRKLRRLIPAIKSPHGIYGVLGNHDCIEMVPDLEEAGIWMLINDAEKIEKDGQQLWLVGVDDPHYYRMANVADAYAKVPEQAFSIFLAHSPEVYDQAANRGAALHLSGHTHGGQICLKEGLPVITNSRAPRHTAAGLWQHKGMTGLTSRGTGASSIPLRYNCRGEIILMTLERSGD